MFKTTKGNLIVKNLKEDKQVGSLIRAAANSNIYTVAISHDENEIKTKARVLTVQNAGVKVAGASLLELADEEKVWLLGKEVEVTDEFRKINNHNVILYWE